MKQKYDLQLVKDEKFYHFVRNDMYNKCILKNDKVRTTAAYWRRILLEQLDKITFPSGRIDIFKAKKLGYGVVEIYKQEDKDV